MIKIAGVDPSISCTGKCVMELDDNYDITNVNFYAWTATKIRSGDYGNVKIAHVGTKYSTFSIQEKQDIAYPLIHEGMDGVSYVAFEGYAFGKKGSSSLVQLGEFNGGLKRELWLKGIGLVVYPPAVVKRFATGNGTADKIMMSAAFRREYPHLYPEVFSKFVQDDSPHADMVDAFWICETLRNHIRYMKNGRETLPEQAVAFLEHKTKKTSDNIVETPVRRKRM